MRHLSSSRRPYRVNHVYTKNLPSIFLAHSKLYSCPKITSCPNPALQIGGVTITVLSIMALVNKVDYISELTGNDLLTGTVYVLLVSGIATTVISFFGCFGASREIKCLLFMVSDGILPHCFLSCVPLSWLMCNDECWLSDYLACVYYYVCSSAGMGGVFFLKCIVGRWVNFHWCIRCGFGDLPFNPLTAKAAEVNSISLYIFRTGKTIFSNVCVSFILRRKSNLILYPRVSW